MGRLLVCMTKFLYGYFRKFQISSVKLRQSILSALLLGVMLPANADIILQAGGEGSIIRWSDYSAPMSGIVIIYPMPSASASPQVTRNLQRAHAWSAWRI